MMNFFAKLVFFFVSIVVFTAWPRSLFAEPTAPSLRWDMMKVEKRIAAGTSGADAVFTFTNTSEEPVRIAVTSSCGCTVGKQDKDVYAAGDTGKVEVHFKVEGKHGRHVNILTVKTEGGSAPVRLEFAVDIYEAMTLERRFLVWNQNRDTTKEVSIRFEDVGKVKAVDVTVDQPGFIAVVKPTEDPNVWTLSVDRVSKTSLRGRCVVKAQTEKAGALETKVFMQGL